MSFLLKVPALQVDQPIGQFFVGVMSAHELLQIASADMRRISGELDAYVGIQRKLNPDRVSEIAAFVNSQDATFPTSIILSVPGSCAQYNDGYLELRQGENEETGLSIDVDKIANILDGQHRLEGLKQFAGERFQLPVCIFVDADIADQAYIFATVNLAQTKVNKSLVYDLLDYAKARSPQKSCHEIAVALDSFSESPLFKQVKRLGTATPGRSGETLAQATFVTSLLPFISTDPQGDRYRLAKGKSAIPMEYQKAPFRHLWIRGDDTAIARILIAYFKAVETRWPVAWRSRLKGDILPRTNGFRALMRFLKLIYIKTYPTEPASTHSATETFLSYFNSVTLQDADFNTTNFPPGSTGETKLFERLRVDAGV